MAERYKVTIGLMSGVYGASESYYTNSISPTQLGPRVQELLDARRAILYDSTQFVGVRVAIAPPPGTTTTSPRRAQFWPPGNWDVAIAGIDLNVPGRGAFVSAGLNDRPDQSRSCLQVRLIFDVDRSTTRYLSFVPDRILFDDATGAQLSNDPAWMAKYILWRNLLTSGQWNIRARSRSGGFTEIPITGWRKSTVAPTDIGFVLPDVPPSGIQASDFVIIKGVRRKGTDKLSYNGRYIVDRINATELPGSIVYYLRGTEAGDVESIKLLGKVQRVGWDYFPINNYQSLRPGVHKRGRPFVAPRGSRKTRVSLDP